MTDEEKQPDDKRAFEKNNAQYDTASADQGSSKEDESTINRLLRKKDEDAVDIKTLTLREEVVSLNRVAKVVKGGRRFSFNAMVVVGDEDGHVGVGLGKANEVPEAISKGVESAKKNIIYIPLVGRTIVHPVVGRYGASKVLLKPAAEGTGIIAGPAVRAVVELAGIKDILTKNLGSQNVINVVKATINGLQSILRPEDVEERRGKPLSHILGSKAAQRYLKSTGKIAEETAEVKEPIAAKEELAEEQPLEKEPVAAPEQLSEETPEAPEEVKQEGESTEYEPQKESPGEPAEPTPPASSPEEESESAPEKDNS